MFIGNGRSNGGTRRHLERSIFDHFRRQLYAISSRLMRPSSDARQTSPTRPTSRVFESSKCRLLSLRLHRREMTLRGAPQTEWSVRSSFSNKLIWPVKRWSNETLSPLPPYCRILLDYISINSLHKLQFQDKCSPILFDNDFNMKFNTKFNRTFVLGTGFKERGFEYPIHYRIKWLESTVAGDSVISWVSLEMVPARACSSSPSNERRNHSTSETNFRYWRKRFH